MARTKKQDGGGSRNKKLHEEDMTMADGGEVSPFKEGQEDEEESMRGDATSDQSFKIPSTTARHVLKGKSCELEMISGDAADVSCGAQIWIHPTVMISEAVSLGDLIAVSLRNASAGGGPHEGSLGTRLLHSHCASEYGVLIGQKSSGGEGGEGGGEGEEEVVALEKLRESPGAFVAVGTAWPSSKLLRSGIRLSRQLADSLGWPAAGTPLTLHPLQLLPPLSDHPSSAWSSPSPMTRTTTTSTPSPDVSIQGEEFRRRRRNTADAESPTERISCRLFSKSTVAAEKYGLDDENPITAIVQPCTKLSLEWCPPAVLYPSSSHRFMPLPSSMERSSSSNNSFQSPRSATRTPQRASPTCPRAMTTSPLASPSSPSLAMRTPKKSQGRLSATENRHSPASTPKSVAEGKALLDGTPGRREPAALGSLAEWEAVRVLLQKGGDGQDKNLVGVMTARWLNGRHLLENNLVVVSICGKDCVFRVAEACCLMQGSAAVVYKGPGSPLPVFKVGYGTEVTISGVAESSGTSVGRQLPFLSTDRRAKELASGSGQRSASGREEEENASREAVVSKSKITGSIGKAGFQGVGGLSTQIAALREMVELPLKNPQLFERYGIRPPRGVLLYGPPGTGKTMLARAMASEFGASMYVINGPEIVSEYYGESESALQAIFADAEKSAPSVVFIDEIDAIAPAREKGAEEFTQRMVAALLTQLDGGGAGKDGNRVVVIAATNRRDSIDPALRRPGRFDRELEIGVPTPAGRLEILQALLQKLPHALKDSDVRYLASATHGFVGADLAVLCNEAAISALRRIVRRKSSSALNSSHKSSNDCRIRLEGGGKGAADGGRDLDEQQQVLQETEVRAEGKEGNEVMCSSFTASDEKEEEDGGLQTEHIENTASTMEKHTSFSGGDGGSGDGDTDRAGLALRCESLPFDSSRSVPSPSSSSSPSPWSASSAVHDPSFSSTSTTVSSTSSASTFVFGLASRSSMPSRASISSDKPLSSSPVRDSSTLEEKPTQLTDSFRSLVLLEKQTVDLEDFESAKTRVRPSAMREVMLEVPAVRWTDIGGQEDIKQRLQEAVEWPRKHVAAFGRVGAKPPKGILLYGPPGCSKTMMARAVATEAGLNFIAVKGPELFSKWVGESEKAVRTLFSRARASAPSVVFFDELDGLAVARGDGGKEEGGAAASDRVISQLLNEIDGLNPLSEVAIIGATNRIDIIDSALLRPGRFDKLLFVGPPDMATRDKIFKIHLRTMPTSSDVCTWDLAESTVNCTGADIAAICREAAMAALEEDLDAKEVCMQHFKIALGLVVPSCKAECGQHRIDLKIQI